MKKVVSGGPTRAMAFTRADAGLPDRNFFILTCYWKPSHGEGRQRAGSGRATVNRFKMS
jgi:hypothetical protein